MRVKLLPRAVKDIKSLWDFGCDTWGIVQADAYTDRIDAAIRALAENPTKAPVADHVGPGLRRLVSGSHAVFYRINGQTIELIRVLHASRDAGRWL